MLAACLRSLRRSIIRKLVTTKRRFVKTAYLPAWLDAEVKAHMQLRDSLKSQNKWPEYKKQRNFVTNLIKRKKKNVITELINTNKTALGCTQGQSFRKRPDYQYSMSIIR